MVVDCRRLGYITTLNGRRRYLPAISAGAPSDVARAERQAVNSLCQGSAADILKAALLAVHSALPAAFPGASRACRMLLPVGHPGPRGE